MSAQTLMSDTGAPAGKRVSINIAQRFIDEQDPTIIRSIPEWERTAQAFPPLAETHTPPWAIGKENSQSRTGNHSITI